MILNGFLFSEISNFRSSFYSTSVKHLKKSHEIMELLKARNCSKTIIKRVKMYRDFLWRKFRGEDDQSFISSMPETIRRQTQYYILENLVMKAPVIPKNEQGPILSIVQVLSIKLYPENEFIIRKDEVADEMFFIIEGAIEIYNSEGESIARLTEGECFGEIALLSTSRQVRTATAISATNVSLGCLKKIDFDIICTSYPKFKEMIIDMSNKRKLINIKHNETKHFYKKVCPHTFGHVVYV